MERGKSGRYGHLLCGAAMAAVTVWAGAAQAQDAQDFSIASQPLVSALYQFGEQSGHQVLFKPDLADAKVSGAVTNTSDKATALTQLLHGTGLSFRKTGDTYLIVQAGEGGSSPQGASAGDVDALIVTAQKREQAIQDVPIAISAFSAKTLQEQKIEGGFDLLKAIPNVTFSKNNFSSYNFSIRGIGTKAISISTDPGVAVAFNSTALIRNRLFEQEYLDIERVEVLRGPQGTLYGRNATAGVINVISAKPDLNDFDGRVKAEVGNYETKRLSAMINVPIIEDVLAVRLAGAMTDREGYDFNATTGNSVNGRDLWTTRLTVGYAPTENIRADLIWERFEEDDNRSRTGKQLCHYDPGRSSVGTSTGYNHVVQGHLSQGCKPGNLYDDAAFGTPNGLSIPFIQVATDPTYISLGRTASGTPVTPILTGVDPYGKMMQSRDLRVINSILDPVYRAKTDVYNLNVDVEISPTLTVTSQTAYVEDSIYSFQDFNRFNTVPIFADSLSVPRPTSGTGQPIYANLTPGGEFCDPQIGCSKSLAGFDISQAKSTQFNQELRLASSFDGPFNFSLGANYTKYKTVEDYYIFYNLITLVAMSGGTNTLFNGSDDYTTCTQKTLRDSTGNITGFTGPANPRIPLAAAEGCIYIDPNPIDSIDGEGHNYYRSKNPYRLESKSVFGEVYYELTDALKLTAGLRYTDDRKTVTPHPTQTLLSSATFLAGTVDRGYPALPDIKQNWGEVTGRIGVDWKPELSFTDQTMLYAFFSHGYKGGGANPPGIGFTKEVSYTGNVLFQTLPYPDTFEPEYIDAIEVGAKNTLLQGAMTLNLGAFYYDYKDYQVSQIKERTAVNENFDATVWGLELEGLFTPTRDLRFNFALGYQDTKIGKGQESIDLMNRTLGDPNYVLVKPYVLFSSNCVVPVSALQSRVGPTTNHYALNTVCGGLFQPVNPLGGPNGGAGLFTQLDGHELPNAPHWTVSLGGQHTWRFGEQWEATVRGDGYWQSQSWHRVYNLDPYDKLHGWYNFNLSVWIENRERDLKLELYAKNLLDKTPITDAFLNSDDAALTTNVFVLDPRLIGFSITKGF